MKRLIYFIIICVIGYFAWSYFKPAHAPEQSIQGHEVLTLPPALPAGKPVNDSFESLVAGAEIYNDVTVRMVFPDSIAIIHRDGAITIPLAKVSKDIQRKYSYDPAFAEEYVSLKAAHAQYKKAKLKEEERAKAESSGTVSEPEKAQAPSLLDQLQQAIPAFASSSSPSPAESPTPTPTPPPTPEEQLQALLSAGPVDASKLATLCEQFPSQANLILKGRQIKVSGTIKQLWVRGIQSADMDIDLIGTPRKDVVFSTDYARYNTEHTGSASYGYKLVKSGKRLLMYSPQRKIGGGTYNTLDHVVHTEGDKVTLEGLIESVGPGDIKIHYAKGIL